MFQLLFLIGWIGVFIISSLGIIYSFVSERFVEMFNFIQTDYSFHGYSLDMDRVLTVLSIFYLLLSIEKFLSIFKGKEARTYVFESESGTISIAYVSIESIVKKVLNDENYITAKKVRIKEKRKKLILNIKIECEEKEGMTGKIAVLQGKITKEIEAITDIKTEKVNIRVSRIVELDDELISTEGE